MSGLTTALNSVILWFGNILSLLPTSLSYFNALLMVALGMSVYNYAVRLIHQLSEWH